MSENILQQDSTDNNLGNVYNEIHIEDRVQAICSRKLKRIMYEWISMKRQC